MQVQKNLRLSIRRCHQRRLQKICSIKKKISSFVRNPNPQNAPPLSVLADTNNIPTLKCLDVKTSPFVSFRDQTPSDRLSDDESLVYSTKQLASEVNLNRIKLDEAKADIERLEQQMKYLEAELLQEECRNEILMKANKELEEMVDNLNGKLEQLRSTIEENDNESTSRKQSVSRLKEQVERQNRIIQVLQQNKRQLQNIGSEYLDEITNLTQQLHNLGQTLENLKLEKEREVKLLAKSLQEIEGSLSVREKQYQDLEAEWKNLQSRYGVVRGEKESYKTKILELEKQIAQSENEFLSTKTSNINDEHQLCLLQTKIAELELALSQHQMVAHQKVQDKNQALGKWMQTKVFRGENLNREFCCSFQVRFKYLQMFLEHISISELPLEPLSMLEPSIYSSIKHMVDKANTRHNGSIFSLSCSFNRILGSYQQIAKLSQNDLSNQIQQQDEPSTPDQVQNQQQLLARMQQEVINMSSSHGINKTDISELKENFQAVKLINQQLFNEVQSKQATIKGFSQKLQFFENYTGIVEHLKANFESLCKELKNPSAKITAILDNVRSLLRI